MDKPLIIVGAGSAGATIAARVSENPDRQVILLESGPDIPPEDPLPPDIHNGKRNSFWDHDWGLLHRPNRHQKVFPMPRGRVVGGSSAVNTCIALRGQPADYDEWASFGLPEWSWEHCLPAFKRLETDLDCDNEFHGQNGPIQIRRHRQEELVPWQAAFLDACERFGFERCFDTNDPRSTGASPHAMNKVAGKRINVGRAYLSRQVRARENFELRARCHLRRVLFDGRKVCGVEYEHQGRIERIETDHVVLSAGSIHSPHILWRSGVGPREDLERIGVEVVAHNPNIARRIVDHPGSAIFFVPRQDLIRAQQDPLIQTVCRYRSFNSDIPNDMQIQPGSTVAMPWLTIPAVTMMCCVGKTAGEGTITWDSAHPHARPIINSKLFEHPRDRARGREAMGLLYDLWRATPLRDIAQLTFPSPRMVGDPKRFDDWIYKASDSGYHPSCTIPMGADEDPLAALDGRGRVRGVEGLRVADASIFPTIPSSNINLPTIMVGERFGEWLRDEDWD